MAIKYDDLLWANMALYPIGKVEETLEEPEDVLDEYSDEPIEEAPYIEPSDDSEN